MDSNLPSTSTSISGLEQNASTGGGDGTMSRQEMIDMSSSWNLGCDNALLMKLKEMSNNLVSSAEDVSKNLSRLERNIVLLDSRVLNATSEFLMLANNQFVENSVQDFQEESASTPVPKILKHKTKSEKESELKIKMKEAIKIGITFNEQKDHERNAQGEEYKFPHLIGSPKFFSSRFCGIFDENKIPPKTNVSLQTQQQDEDAIEKRFIDITSSTSNYSNAPQTTNFYESNPDSSALSAPEIITRGNSSSIKSKESVHSLSSTSSLFGDHDGAQIGGAFSVGSSVSNDLSASCDKIIVNQPQQPNQNDVNPRQSFLDDLNNAIKSKCPPPPPLSESEEESDDEFVPTGQRFFSNEEIFDKKPPKMDLFTGDDESDDDIFSNKEFNSKYKPSVSAIESIPKSKLNPAQPISELFSNQNQPNKEFQHQGTVSSKEEKIISISTNKNSTSTTSTGIQKSNIEDLFYTDSNQTIAPTATTTAKSYPPQIDDIFDDEMQDNYPVTRKEGKIIEPIPQIEKKEVKKNPIQVQNHAVTDNNATRQIHKKTTDQNPRPRPQPQLQPNIYSVPIKSPPPPPKDIFADESDDDDLFFKRIKDKSSTKKPAPIIQKLQVKKSLFDDSDSEDELIKTINTNSSSSTSIKINKKLDNLFAADNDDEDLFFSSPNPNSSKSKEMSKPMPNKIVREPEPNETTTTYSNDSVNKDLVEEDNIKKRDPQPKPKLQVKSSLFQDSDDSDESDLFSSKSSQSSSKEKEKPKMKPSESIRSSNNSIFLSNLNNLLATGPTKIKKNSATEPKPAEQQPKSEITSDADEDEVKANKSSSVSELEDQLMSSQEIETTNSKSETSNLLIGPAKTRVKMMSKRRPPSKTLLRNAFKFKPANDSNLFPTRGSQPEPEDITDDDEENTNS